MKDHDAFSGIIKQVNVCKRWLACQATLANSWKIVYDTATNDGLDSEQIIASGMQAFLSIIVRSLNVMQPERKLKSSRWFFFLLGQRTSF